MIRTAMMAGALLLAGAAQAEVVSADAAGFSVRSVATIAAPPATVWAALVTPGRWWNVAHSWSGDGANMRLDPVAGGCFCETIPKETGEAEHGRVVYVVPNRTLRLSAALGPFQSMGVAGALSWELKPVAGGTQITQGYAVGGHIPGGGIALAPVVDMVMGGQLDRLKAFVEKK